jgi:hypothetical protein
VVPFPLSLPYELKLLGIAAILLTVLAWVGWQWSRCPKELAARTPPSDGSRGEVSAVLALTVLLVSAAVNGLTDWLLLPGYLFWGTWYAVPEMISIVLGVASAGILLVSAAGVAAERWSKAGSWAVRAAVVVLGCWTMAVGLRSSLRAWEPQHYDPSVNPTQAEAYLGIRWINANLPPGSRIGSYSAGLIGYFTNNMHVVNLDGLANSPGFVTQDVLGHLLFLRGLAPTDPIVAYLGGEAIGYLANVDPVDRVQNGPYLGLVASSQARLLYVGAGSIDWGPGQPLRKFIVVQLER